MDYVDSALSDAWYDRGEKYFVAQLRREAACAPVASSTGKAALRLQKKRQLEGATGSGVVSAEPAVLAARISQLENELQQFYDDEPPVEFNCAYHYEVDDHRASDIASSRTVRRWHALNEGTFDLAAYWRSPELKLKYPLLSSLVPRLLVVRVHSIDVERVCVL
jgi:hypothetical protein